MKPPLISIIIPTHNRPELLARAVDSALSQTLEEIEVIVVDDGSTPVVQLPARSRLRLVRLEPNQGGAAARNRGAEAAQAHWITYLDDDDILMPDMAEKALQNIAVIPDYLPKPVGLLFGLKVINSEGALVSLHVPPTLPRGSHFALEEIPSDQSFFSKQTLVIERDTLLAIGGFDPSFTSRVHTELFLRLNAACSLWGIPDVTYQLSAHDGSRVSSNPKKRHQNFEKLLIKHHGLFVEHSSKKKADFLINHALMMYKSGWVVTASRVLCKAFFADAIHTVLRLGSPIKKRIFEIKNAINKLCFSPLNEPFIKSRNREV